MQRFIICALFSSLVSYAMPSFADPLTFQATLIGSSNDGVSVAGLNNAGQVIGNATLADGNVHAFITGPNGIGATFLPAIANYDSSFADRINNSGEVVGTVWNSKTNATASFITGPDGAGGRLGPNEIISGMNDSAQIIGTPLNSAAGFISGPQANGAHVISDSGVTMDSVIAINNVGQVIGTAGQQVLITQPSSTGTAVFDTLGNTREMTPDVLNNSGLMAGTLMGPGSQCNADCFYHDVFIMDTNNQSITNLGNLRGSQDNTFTSVEGINDAGWIVGADEGADYYQHAFVGNRSQGLIDLNSLVSLSDGSYLDNASAINDSGQMLVHATDGNYYLVTPVPEPESVALVMLGIAGIRLIRARKRNN